jgi:hypothetical protein
MHAIFVARMEVAVVLLSSYYVQSGKYFILCLFVTFCVYTLLPFYTYVPHW